MTQTSPPVCFEDVQAAARRIREHVYSTPCPPSEPLSEITGCQIYCKLDYLQRTGSFKERGARNALALLSEADRAQGVIAASAGNHALALAYHGRQMGIPVTVVMPRWAPITKVNRCQQPGVRVIQHGTDFAQARQHADELVEREGLTYVHGYDDPAVIAGQGTMGLEIIEQVPDVEAVVVPVGGGGLIAGVGLAIKTLRPSVRVIGVEPARCAKFAAALAADRSVVIDTGATLADGLAVPGLGERAFAVAREVVDEVVSVDERSLALAVLRLVEREKAVVEGAGAASLAALLAGRLPELQGKKVVLPLCGGNIDTTMLGRIMERGLAADGRLCQFTCRISDRPGGLTELTARIAAEGASIQQISHDRAFTGGDLTDVDVHCVIETFDREHIARVRNRLTKDGFVASFREPTV